MARKAWDLTLEKGILAIPDSQIVNKISQEVMETVKFFYEDDEYNMMMPGVKDRVRAKKNKYNQKYLEIKIVFSTDCCLCRKWCCKRSLCGVWCKQSNKQDNGE
ncbi:hypothetical protein AVEN_169765-1 [Araneus ventricosus]|uniref:Uncharacterized protein n=1 Tax=Araneus ventricosus TaxID=182803 RepID=A0A4Y2HLZ3_ARAVE|nr:hypothetical protein AVEN_169765-1 [Araneus ventricosus]